MLRRKLLAHHWAIVNDTPLPTVCFIDASTPNGSSAQFIDEAARQVVASGKAWISSTRLGGNLPVLRACITNYQTQEEDIFSLVDMVNDVRSRL